MLSEEDQEKLHEGIRLFNQKDYFEAHEYFEELWQTALDANDVQEFLFLVRMAAAGVHVLNGNRSSEFLFNLAMIQLQNGLQLKHCRVNL
jgi:predicted metal-dependent hydrolase